MEDREKIKLLLNLTGGLAVAALACGDREAVVRASYLTDAPSDLIHAVRSLLEGRSEAICAW